VVRANIPIKVAIDIIFKVVTASTKHPEDIHKIVDDLKNNDVVSVKDLGVLIEYLKIKREAQQEIDENIEKDPEAISVSR
jgi:hypothetical protein